VLVVFKFIGNREGVYNPEAFIGINKAPPTA
jgi:hypothetical protein